MKQKPWTGRICGTAIAILAAVVSSASPAAAVQSKAKHTKTTGTPAVDIMLMAPTAPKSGENQFEVTVKDANGKPIADAEVSVLLVMPAMPAMKMPAMRNEVKLKSSGDGKYAGSGNVPMAGRWNATVSVKRGGRPIGQKKLTLNAK